MIGKLRGRIDTIGEDHIILDVNGVGYIVFASSHTMRNLPEKEAVLIIDTHVREDHIHLYGFATEEERAWFRLLTSVQGIGPKLALTALSTLSPEQLSAVVMSQDKKTLSTVSGIGPKLAERTLTELKNKKTPAISVSNITTSAVSSRKNNAPDALNDAVSALSNLGYAPSDAFTVVSKLIEQKQEASLEELIKYSLKELA